MLLPDWERAGAIKEDQLSQRVYTIASRSLISFIEARDQHGHTRHADLKKKQGDLARKRHYRRFRRFGPREEISKDRLDNELDHYMSGTQNVISVGAEA